MGGGDEPEQVVEATANVSRRRHQVDQHETSAGAADPHHLGDGVERIGEVVQWAPAVGSLAIGAGTRCVAQPGAPWIAGMR